MVRNEVAEGWHRDNAQMAAALSEALRARRAAEAEAAALRLEVAVWRARAEEADARARLDWLRRVA
jgi:hypothetical protein